MEILDRLMAPPDVDEEIVEKLSMFNVKQIFGEDPDVLINIGLWRRDSDGRMTEPIDIVDTFDFPDLVLPKEELILKLSKYHHIYCSKKVLEEDELPF
jgi:hypothetical protein